MAHFLDKLWYSKDAKGNFSSRGHGMLKGNGNWSKGDGNSNGNSSVGHGQFIPFGHRIKYAKFVNIVVILPKIVNFDMNPQHVSKLMSPPMVNTSGEVSQAPAFTSPWLLDSRATNHVTNGLGNLLLTNPYSGDDQLVVRNGAISIISVKVIYLHSPLIFPKLYFTCT